MTLDQHLESDPATRRGAVKLRGSRLSVADLVLMHLRQGKTVDQIAGDFLVSLAAVHAALSYYFDHRVEIDRQIAADEHLADEVRRRTPSLLREKLGVVTPGR